MGFSFSFHFLINEKLVMVFLGTKGIWTQASKEM